MKSGAVITLNKAREGKEKASIEYDKKNVKEAKAATD
jgi:hypothetical protein